MSVRIDESGRLFTIHTCHTTYQMKADDKGVLLHLYYGTRTAGSAEYLLTYSDRGFAANPFDAGLDRTYSLDVLPQEFPVSGTGDMRSPAMILRTGDGTTACDLRFKSYSLENGKYALQGLPAVYAEKEEAQTLKIILEDTAGLVEVTLLYGVLPELDIITRSVIVRSLSEQKVILEKILSANIDFLTGKYDLITFQGRHAMERSPEKTPVTHLELEVGTRRGQSSHQINPLMILAEEGTSERTGSCYALQFVYSGGFSGCAGMDQFNQTRIQLGLMSEKFSWPLEQGETFTAPEVIMSFSAEGLTRLSQNLQDCLRTHVCRGKWRDRVRPVLLNSWEAFYMDFDGADILALAEQAKSLGIEMVVMDDGWFGARDDDLRALGDWFVNEKKLGGKLKDLGQQIHAKGLQFGIWVEPEMVNEVSCLFREHPDWAMAVPGRNPVRGRNQLVLDFSRKEVVDEIFRRICRVLDEGEIDYLKWDFNRSIADVFSHTASHQGKVLHEYILGLYDFLERLCRRYPDMLIEGCAGGGGRFDAGMLYYAPQIWCSDNTDAIDRLRIQYGTSFGYPVSCVGAHVSTVPNEQNGRITPLKTRGIVAMSGTFGYELDPGKLTDEEKREIRQQIIERNRFAEIILNGKYYRLSDPFHDDVAAWLFVSRDKKEALLNIVNLEVHGNRPVTYVKLNGLQAGAMYRDDASEKEYPADVLMQTGMPVLIGLPSVPADREYQSIQILLRKQD